MKISIIIVSYNEEKYLDMAVKSCFEQSIFEEGYEVEIIIGDDGSSDGSIDIIKSWRNKYPEVVKYFVMDRENIEYVIPSIRASNVLKKAFSIAKGDYIQILSGDDILLDKQKILTAIKFLDVNKDYSCCYSDYIKFWDDGKEVYPKTKKCQFSRPVLWSFEYRHISCYLFRKDVINNLLDRFCDDTGLFYSCFITGKAKNLPGITFAYRQRTESIMRTSDDIDLNLLEILLYQDVLNRNYFPKSTYAKFYRPLMYVWNNRLKLNDIKYMKYFKESSKYNNDVLSLISNYEEHSLEDKIKLRILLFNSAFYRIIFKILDVFETIFR